MAKDKKLSPDQIQSLLQWITNNPAPPTEAVGAKGSKPFVGDKKATESRQKAKAAGTAGLNSRVPVTNMNDLSSPKWWLKNIVAGGKSAVVDPVIKASKMDWANPSSDLAPIDRLNTFLGDALTVGSMVAPAGKAATKGMGLYDDLASRLADRYAYGIHISPTGDLKSIDVGSNMAKKLWRDSETGTNYFFDTSKLNPTELKSMNEYLTLYGRGEKGSPTVYSVRTPKKFAKLDENYGTGFPDWIEQNSKYIPRPTRSTEAKALWEAGAQNGYSKLPDGTSVYDYATYPVNAFNTPKKLKVLDSIKLNSNYQDVNPSGFMRDIFPNKWDEKQFVDFLKKSNDAQPSPDLMNKFWLNEYLDSSLKGKKVKDLGNGKKSLDYEYGNFGLTKNKVFNDEETLKKFLKLLDSSPDNAPNKYIAKIFDIINNKGIG